MVSLRRRLLVGTALGTGAVLLVSGIALYAMMRASLYSQFDDSLRQKAHTLASLIEQDDEGIELEFTEADMLEFKRPDRQEYFQVWHADGRVLARSPSLNSGDLTTFETVRTGGMIREAVLPNGHRGRIATVKLTPRPDEEEVISEAGTPLVLALGRDVLDVEAALTTLASTLILVGLAGMLVSLGLLGWLVQIGLKPVGNLAGRIGAVGERDLSTRLDPENLPRELRPIALQLNALLARLGAAFDREKTMTADVAHELRTPLAGIRSTLEVSLSQERKSDSYREAMSNCVAICEQTQAIIENLLALARLDAGGEALRQEPVDVGELLQSEWKPFAPAGEAIRVRVEFRVEHGFALTTDKQQLVLVMRNLFENAAHYVDTEGEISIQAGRLEDRARIIVSNSGSQVAAEDAERVFDRFWRGDASRENVGAHCGLGLSICKVVVERLGGTITASSSKGGSFSVVLTL